MNPILSCCFNMDAACVELRFLDGTTLAIDTVAVEDEVAANMYERSKPDYQLVSADARLLYQRKISVLFVKRGKDGG